MYLHVCLLQNRQIKKKKTSIYLHFFKDHLVLRNTRKTHMCGHGEKPNVQEKEAASQTQNQACLAEATALTAALPLK